MSWCVWAVPSWTWMAWCHIHDPKNHPCNACAFCFSNFLMFFKWLSSHNAARFQTDRDVLATCNNKQSSRQLSQRKRDVDRGDVDGEIDMRTYCFITSRSTARLWARRRNITNSRINNQHLIKLQNWHNSHLIDCSSLGSEQFKDGRVAFSYPPCMIRRRTFTP